MKLAIVFVNALAFLLAFCLGELRAINALNAAIAILFSLMYLAEKRGQRQ